MLSRLLKGVGANSFSQIVTIISQLISVPVLISGWGVEKYGIWLALSAVPAYLVTANFGMANAAASYMTMAVASEEKSKVRNYYDTANVSTVFMSFLLLCLIFLGYFLVSEFSYFNYMHDVQRYSFVLMLLCLGVVVSLFNPLWDAALRCVGLYHYGVLGFSCFRLLEQILLFFGVLYWSFDYEESAISLLVVRLLSFLFFYFFVSSSIVNLSPSFNGFSKETFKYMIRPALGHVSMPLGFAFAIQGAVIAAASITPTFAVMYSSTRTLASIIRQVVLVYSKSSWPEMSMAFGSGNNSLVRKLFWWGVWITLIISIFLALLVWLAGDWFYAFWTNGALKLDWRIFIFVYLSVILSSIWNQIYILLASRNELSVFSIVFIFVNVLAFFLAYMLKDEVWMMTVYLASEFVMVLSSLVIAKRYVL